MLRSLLLFLSLSLLAGCNRRPNFTDGPASAPIISQADMKASLWGLSPQEVRAKLGSPDNVSTPAIARPSTANDSVWSYPGRTRSPETSKPDSRMYVVFHENRVIDVTFDAPRSEPE